MSPVVRGAGVVTLVLLGLAIAGGASAESRLFSVRTTKPGVTIVQASLDRRDLRVAGQNGNATFFRIDNPSGPVPCSNRIRFVASDGSSVDAPVDLCANNWTLTVATSALPAPSAQPAPAAQVSGHAGQGQPVAIATDDPNVTITGVYIASEPVTITARRDPYVQVFLPRGPKGTQCSQDLGLALSDGRRIARLVDVCRSNAVVVSLAGSGYAPAAPTFASAAPAAPVQPQPAAPLPPPAPVAVAPVQPAPGQPPAAQPAGPPMQWFFSAPGGAATVSYSMPGGGLGGFRAVCVPRAASATITLGATAPEVRQGETVNVSLGAGAFRNTYSGIGSPRSENDGLAHPVLSVPLSDPLWAALITERSLAISVGRGAPIVLPLSGSSDQVKQFLSACARPQYGGSVQYNPPPPPPPPDNDMALVPPVPDMRQMQPPPPGMDQRQPGLPPAPMNAAVSYACDDGEEFSATFSGSSVTVLQYGIRPMTLYQAPSQEGTRYVGDGAQLIGEGESVYWRHGGGATLTCSPR